MRANLGVLRDVVRTKRQHLSTCYDHGYLDHQWGYTRRDRSRLTDPQQGAYQAGWRAADEDGTADCFATRPQLHSSTASRPIGHPAEAAGSPCASG